jgi:hypothetical protein
VRRLGVSVVLAVAVFALAATSAFASVHVFSTSFASSGSGDGQVSLAANSGVAVNDTTHDVYVADAGNARVDEFSSAGAFIRAWGWGVADGTTAALQTCTAGCQPGIAGAGLGQFTTPTFIAVDNSIGLSQSDVYVGDAATNTVSKFSSSGAYISTNDGSAATTPVAGPFGPLGGVTVDSSGDLWVYDTTGNMFEFGQDASSITGWNSGRGVTPNGIAADSAGNLYVLTGGGSVEQFTAAGHDVGPVNGDASDPTGLALDRAKSEVYMDSGGSLIRHYAASCDAGGSCAATDNFGSGELNAGAGLGVDATSGSVYAADSGAQAIVLFTAVPPAPPVVDETSAANVTQGSADLRAQINPQAADTTYHFQYGASSSYGQSTPESASIGSDVADHSAAAHIQGLLPNTTYHYRVVARNSAASAGVAGPDHTLTTQAPAASFTLPDGRGYELVTPADKGDGSLLPAGDGLYAFGGGYEASSDGGKLAYLAVSPFPGSRAGGVDNYIASRGPGGWSSQDLSPRQDRAQNLLWSPTIAAFSSDLSKSALEIGGGGGFVGQDDPPLVSGEPPNNENLFLRDSANASSQLVDLTPPGVTPGPAGFSGASADLSHVVFTTDAQLTPNGLNDGNTNLYQWLGGAISLVDQIPVAPATRCGGGGPPCITAPSGANLGTGNSGDANELNAVSRDGSKVFFQDATGYSFDRDTQLYMREGGTTTVEISASRKTNGSGPGGTDANGPLPAQYWPASADGSKAFFTSCQQLTNDSTAVFDGSSAPSNCRPGVNAGGVGSGSDLYQYDTGSGGLSDLTVDHNGDPLGADVQGVLGASDDGAYVYFVANGVLASGASLGNCGTSGSVWIGQCNLYLSHNGTNIFIARLDGNGDQADWYYGGVLNVNTARVTPDGTRLAFGSRRSLTGYDNNVASGSTCAQGIYDNSLPTSQCQEIFLYDANSGQLHCASCDPSGAQPLGPASIASAGEHGDHLTGAEAFWFDHVQRNLSADGRLFFDSADGLVAGDVNYKVDVYEYADGRPRLISSGTSASDSVFIDASATGNDVFFQTEAQLVGQDTDQRSDIYDARVGGGGPALSPQPVACVADSCRPATSAAGAEPALASASFTGAGNQAVSTVAPVAVSVLSKTVRGAGISLRLRVPAKGSVTISGRGAVTVRRSVTKPGTYVLKIELTAASRRRLRGKHKLKLGLRVGFAPTSGQRSSETVSVTVKTQVSR